MGIKDFFYYTGIGMLFTHELDAVANHEWRVLPLTSWLSEQTAFSVFILAHIPLFAALSALIASKNDKIRNKTAFGISLFLMLHGILHFLFTGFSNYEFSGLLSNFLIYGGAFCGISYLALGFKEKSF